MKHNPLLTQIIIALVCAAIGSVGAYFAINQGFFNLWTIACMVLIACVLLILILHRSRKNKKKMQEEKEEEPADKSE